METRRKLLNTETGFAQINFAPIFKAAFHLSVHKASCRKKYWVGNMVSLLNNAGFDASFSGPGVFDQNMQNSIM